MTHQNEEEEYDFNRDDVEDDGFGEAMPLGVYPATIDDVEVKQNNAGTGSYFNFQFRIDESVKYGNRCVFDMINWKNDSDEAVAIGRQRLAQLCDAIKSKGFKRHPKELIGKKLRLRLGIEKDEEYGDKNIVRRYLAASTDEPGDSKGGGSGSDDDVPW